VQAALIRRAIAATERMPIFFIRNPPYDCSVSIVILEG